MSGSWDTFGLCFIFLELRDFQWGICPLSTSWKLFPYQLPSARTITLRAPLCVCFLLYWCLVETGNTCEKNCNEDFWDGARGQIIQPSGAQPPSLELQIWWALTGTLSQHPVSRVYAIHEGSTTFPWVGTEMGHRAGESISPDCHSESACSVQNLHHPGGLAVLSPISRSPSLPHPSRPLIKLLHMKPMVLWRVQGREHGEEFRNSRTN